MRLKNELRCTGYFWRSTNPSDRVSGTLVIRDGGEIHLETIGMFNGKYMSEQGLQEKPDFERIIGHVEKHGPVTLDGCIYTSMSFAPGSLSIIQVNIAIVGASYDDKEEILFRKFQFSVEGLDEWVAISGIKVLQQSGDRPSVTYTPPKEVSLKLNNGLVLSINFNTSLETSHLKEAKITQKIYFELASEDVCPSTIFTSASHKIANFLGFALGTTVCLEQISATVDVISPEGDGKQTEPASVLVFYRSLPFTPVQPKINPANMLFKFAQISAHVERVFNQWFSAYDEIDSALNLYFAMKSGAYKYVDGKFLALAQALETYHRRTSKEKLMTDEEYEELTRKLLKHCPQENQEWLEMRLKHGNELSLSKRLGKIITPFESLIGEKRERNKLIRDIVDTRNYLTHFDKSSKSRASKGRKLSVLFFKVEAIFQLHLLHVVGFTHGEIQGVVNSCHSLRSRLELV